MLSSFGKECVMYGQDPGLKTQGLLDLQKELLALRFDSRMRQSLTVLPGAGLGTSIYRDIAREMVKRDGSSPDWSDYVLTDEFESATREICELLSVGRPVAIRSSGIVEEASGKYKTSFYARQSTDFRDDLRVFRGHIAEIYEDYYYKNLRGQVFCHTEDIDVGGMGILIHPVVGSVSKQDRTLFAPAIAGVFTVVDGEPYLKVVVGLGTRTVGIGEGVIKKGEKLLKSPPLFVTGLEKLRNMHALKGPDFEEIVEVPIAVGVEPERFYPFEFIKLSDLADVWLGEYQSHRPRYWEFAIDPSYRGACILQSAQLSPSIIRGYELSHPKGKVIYQFRADADNDNHAVHIGRKESRGIVFVNIDAGFKCGDLGMLDLIGNEHPGFLLLVPPVVFSADYRLKLTSLRNAAGIVELRLPRSMQVLDPANNKFLGSGAGSHLISGSEYKNLIFQAVTLQDDPDIVIEDLLGEPQKIYGRDIYFWDRGFVIENAQKGARLALLDF